MEEGCVSAHDPWGDAKIVHVGNGHFYVNASHCTHSPFPHSLSHLNTPQELCRFDPNDNKYIEKYKINIPKMSLRLYKYYKKAPMTINSQLTLIVFYKGTNIFNGISLHMILQWRFMASMSGLMQGRWMVWPAWNNIKSGRYIHRAHFITPSQYTLPTNLHVRFKLS